MAELVIRTKDRVVERIDLNQGDLTLGRAPDNDIHIDSPSISERHVRFFTVGPVTSVQDLNSTNGTYVNDEPVKHRVLRSGDVLTIGNHDVEYLRSEDDEEEEPITQELGAPDADAEAEDDAEVVADLTAADDHEEDPEAPSSPFKLDLDLTPPEERTTEEAPVVTTETPIFVTTQYPALDETPFTGIEIESGINEGKRVAFQSGEIALGSDGKREARVVLEGGVYRMTRLDADTTLRINDEELENDPVDLNDGDNIDVGNIQLRFCQAR